MLRQNEDIVAIDAELVGLGNGVRYGRGDQRCTLFAGRPRLWCRLRVCAILRRTGHVDGGLKIPASA